VEGLLGGLDGTTMYESTPTAVGREKASNCGLFLSTVNDEQVSMFVQ